MRRLDARIHFLRRRFANPRWIAGSVMTRVARDRTMARITAVVATAAMLVAAAQAFAQGDAATHYPNRAVKVIVSAPAGGGLDIAARVIADRLAKMWGQPFGVGNRPGPRGHLRAEAGAPGRPHRHTLLPAPPGPPAAHRRAFQKINL